MFEIYIDNLLLLFLKNLSKDERELIKDSFDKLQRNPYMTNENLDIKSLLNIESIHYRLKVGNFHFIYEILDLDLKIVIHNTILVPKGS